jgi:hypothetical protein
MSQDDQTLKQAIQASLKDLVADESELLPLEETVREGGRSVPLPLLPMCRCLILLFMSSKIPL